MAKEICPITGKKLGLLKVKLEDGYYVNQMMLLKYFPTTPAKKVSLQMLKDRISEIEAFTPTKKVGDFLQIDQPNKKIKLHRDMSILNYEDLTDVELLEDGNTISKKGIGRAVAGGVLLGGVGALVGAATGSSKGKSTSTMLSIKITTNDINNPTRYINFISTETKKSGFIYKTAYASAQECISILNLILDEVESEPLQPNNPTDSVVDEIRKFKSLLDDGIITQEEFDAKKKELLGL